MLNWKYKSLRCLQIKLSTMQHGPDRTLFECFINADLKSAKITLEPSGKQTISDDVWQFRIANLHWMPRRADSNHLLAVFLDWLCYLKRDALTDPCGCGTDGLLQPQSDLRPFDSWLRAWGRPLGSVFISSQRLRHRKTRHYRREQICKPLGNYIWPSFMSAPKARTSDVIRGNEEDLALIIFEGALWRLEHQSARGLPSKCQKPLSGVLQENWHARCFASVRLLV
jgi:hypothetical protein